MFLSRHRWMVAVALVIAAGGLLACSSRLRFNEDFSDMLPLSDQRISGSLQAAKLFHQMDRLFVDVSSADADPETLGRASDAMAQRLAAIPALNDIRHRMDIGGLHPAIQYFFSRLPCYFSEEARDYVASRTQAESLGNRMAWLKKSMSGPQGAVLKELAVLDPIGIGDVLGSGFKEIQAGFGGMRVVAGRLTSEDGRHILITAVPDMNIADTKRSRMMLGSVMSEASAVEKDFAEAHVRVVVGGGHRVTLDNVDQIMRDAGRTALVDTIALMTLIWFVYRRRWMALFTILPSIFGVLCGAAVIYFIYPTVSMVALGFGSILLGITIDNAVHVIYHLDDEQPEGRQAVADNIAQLTLPIASGVLTTMATFFILCLSPVLGHRQLGLYAMVGVPVAAILSVVVLPLIVPHRIGEKKPPLWLTRLFGRVFVWLEVHARLLLPVVIIFSIVCAFGIERLRFDGDMNHLNYMSPETREAQRLLEQAWGRALSLTTIVVKGSSMEEALRKNEDLNSMLRQARSKGEIESFMSVAPLVPSVRTQEVNMDRWREFWANGRLESFSRDFEQAATNLGFRAGAFGPFLRSLSQPSGQVSLSEMTETPIGARVAEYVRPGTGSCAVVTMVKVGDRDAFLSLHQKVSARIPDALIANGRHLGDMIAEISKEQLIRFGLLVTLVSATMLFLVFGRPEIVLITLLPVFTGVFWTLGTLGLMGYAINLSNVIFVVFVFGACIDYSLLHVTGKLAPVRGFPSRMAAIGGSVSICAVTGLIGIGVYVIARHPALHAVGVTALLGIAFSVFSAVVLVPLCMDWVLRRPVPEMKGPTTDAALIRKHINGLYRYQGPFVENFVFWKMRSDPLFLKLDAAVPRRADILDLGCGYGMASHWLSLQSPDRTLVGVDYDAGKIRVAGCTASGAGRVTFEQRDILTWPFPKCDAVLLLDVLHYWVPEKQQALIVKAREALRPGGRLVLRDGARAETDGHRSVARWERMATRFGFNRTVEGLHFLSEKELKIVLERAGFRNVEMIQGAGRGSNIMLVAST